MPRAMRQPRRGVSLLLVVVLLALFFTIGLTFLFYATNQAESARLYREAQQTRSADIDPEHLAKFFLGQLLFDARDDEAGVASALRGHSLMRSAYGLNYDIDSGGATSLKNNTVAFNGTGRLHHTYGGTDPVVLQGQDDYQLINYTYFPADGFLRDPERLGRDHGWSGYRTDPTKPRCEFTGGFNASYTYPDLNNTYLAAVKADGTLLIPSFHRPWLIGGKFYNDGDAPQHPTNPVWYDQPNQNPKPGNGADPTGKYKMLRPRPIDMGRNAAGNTLFPYPEDNGGDVKNLIGAPGGNDSVWLDLGYPVQTAPDGRRFKPLFAALVLDLDGRLNVNVHGNVRGADGAHASNQGWGPWEVNLSPVVTDAEERLNLFRGVAGAGNRPRLVGRYGPDLAPTGSGPTAFGNPPPPFYARVDFNGTSVAKVQPPLGTDCFPTFPTDYDNAAADALPDHPSNYRVQGRPAYADGDHYDRRFGVSNMEKLLRFGDTGSGALTSELLQLCPKAFTADRARRLVTTDSADLDRPGAAPWLWGLYSSANAAREPRDAAGPEKLGGGGPKLFPQDRTLPPLVHSEFDPQSWRSLTAALGRIDLSQPLPDYPADPTTESGRADFLKAQTARQDLAKAIYLRLIKATGAYDPMALGSPYAAVMNLSPPSLQEFQTLRWLAQVAVNIVDYVDQDDVITPFHWGEVGSSAFRGLAVLAGGDWVFGTELPHVLINEVYAEYLNEPGETGQGRKAKQYRVNLWVELYNPFRGDLALPPGNGSVQLDGVYQVVVSKPNSQLLSLSDPAEMANTLGNPDGTGPGQTYDPAQVYRYTPSFSPPTVAVRDQPGGGFYVLGPPLPIPGVDAGIPGAEPTMRSEAMTYVVSPVTLGSVRPPPQPTVMLRRLACPSLPWQPDSAVELYNPYVTVDYASNVPLNRGATNTGAGYSPLLALQVVNRKSYGRREPFDGREAAFSEQPPPPQLAGQPQPRHTFFAHNQPLQQPFQWLVHLDRPPISPVELLHVSTCKPHQLTHLFRNDSPDGAQPFRHTLYAQIWNPDSPLHRLFEFLETGYRAAGTGPGRRIPGRVNLNSIWDKEVFQALCDPQPSNSFTDENVSQVYNDMLASRTPGSTPGPNDRPFKGLGSANFTQSGDVFAEGVGLEDTLFRSKYPPAMRLFEVAKEHPYQRLELLNKIFNSVTTRSNVFAVWLTVGFFEVTDATSTPVKLGAELGRAENRQVRHRTFAIVDRSQLVRLFPGPGQRAVTAQNQIAAGQLSEVIPSTMGSAVPGSGAWTIQPGTVLHVRGPGPDGTTVAESVAVSSVGPNYFTATFANSYPTGLTSITATGNPGPGADLNPPGGPVLVPHLSIIQ